MKLSDEDPRCYRGAFRQEIMRLEIGKQTDTITEPYHAKKSLAQMAMWTTRRFVCEKIPGGSRVKRIS